MHLDKFDLNLLVAIDAILRRRNVTAAAEDLHITQSAMSSALKRARAYFEDDLFYYDGRAMVPTTFGAELETRIPGLITQLRALTRLRANTDLQGLTRRFTVIASDYVCIVYLSALTKRLAEIAPDVSLSVVPYTREAIRQFDRGVVDFLIGPKFAMKPDYGMEVLYDDGFKCVYCGDNPIAAGGLTRATYFSSPMVVTNFFLEDGKSHFERWLEAYEPDVRIVAALPSFVVLPFFISGTPNIATIHERLVPYLGEAPGLVFADPPVHVPRLVEYLATTPKHQHDSDAQLLAQVMRDVGAAM